MLGGRTRVGLAPGRKTVPQYLDRFHADVPAADAGLAPMTNHQFTLGAVNLEAADPVALAKFWAAVTGAESSSGGDSVYLPPSGPGGFGMFFQPESGPRADRQVAHWDLTVPWGSRAAEVERLIGFGATHQWDALEEFAHVQWTTLADPEGNLFCVAEHLPADERGS